MNNMLLAIVPKSDQLNYDDLIGGQIKTIKITDVSIGKHEQPVAINYEGANGKPYKPCKSMCRVMVHVWGPDAKAYTGRSMTLYGDPDVLFAGQKVGGLRISHMSHLAKEEVIVLTTTRSIRRPFTVRPLESTGQAVPKIEDYLADIESAPTKEGLEHKYKSAYKLFTSAADREKLTAAKDKRKKELTTTENINASIP